MGSGPHWPSRTLDLILDAQKPTARVGFSAGDLAQRLSRWGSNLDEDALAGALLGGLDRGFFLAGRNHGETFGATGI